MLIVRDHVLAGRSFTSLAEIDAAFTDWLPIRRAQIHRTHGEVISVGAERDRIALTSLPSSPYLVTDRHLRRVGKDCLVSFEASLYSLPLRPSTPGNASSCASTRRPWPSTRLLAPAMAAFSRPIPVPGPDIGHGTQLVLVVPVKAHHPDASGGQHALSGVWERNLPGVADRRRVAARTR